MNELKLCPFCAEEGYLEIFKVNNIYVVHCDRCCAEGPTDLGESGAIVQWNTRPIENDIKLLIAAAELEWCPACRGKGVIDPIENPPYKCDDCNGRGWISPYVIREVQDRRGGEE